MSDTRRVKVINSALWAAYGDAFGFITELADSKILKNRLGGNSYVEELSPWKRRIGGTHGATIELPAGIFSDDTQLRLSTSRAILSDGTFDVEAFAKVELPVWLSYSLGAGRGSKLAASNLSKSNVSYFSNFYKEKDAKYITSGGNGASMRIQPHVWSKPQNNDIDDIVSDVFLNSICTHGDMVAISGAVFHALCLESTLRMGAIPDKKFALNLAGYVSKVNDVIPRDSQVSNIWKPTWEKESGIILDQGISRSIDMLEDYIFRSFELIEKKGLASISDVFYELDAFNPAYRGSSLLTSAVSVAVAHHVSSASEGEMAIKRISNCLGVDTDTIATKVGALIGCIVDEKPESPIIDSDYIQEEAKRLFDISQGVCEREFSYPNILKWEPPKYQNAALCEDAGQLVLEGLGRVQEIDGERFVGGNSNNIWEWVYTAFGQTLLVKRKSKLDSCQDQSIEAGYTKRTRFERDRVNTRRQGLDLDTERRGRVRSDWPSRRVTPNVAQAHREAEGALDELTSLAIDSNFDARLIGEHILKLSEDDQGIEKAVAYVSIISKAKRARKKRRG